jgi:prepilin-type N-terminal cleavage/methylation domain-containing protein
MRCTQDILKILKIPSEKRRQNMGRAFTLIELIIVIIILGILVSISMPRFQDVQEKAKAIEGIRLLGDIRESNIRYYNAHEEYTSSLDDLDIEVSNIKFFSTYLPYNCLNSWGMNCCIGGVMRSNISNPGYGNYWLYITRDGDLFCNNGANNICDKLGIQETGVRLRGQL